MSIEIDRATCCRAEEPAGKNAGGSLISTHNLPSSVKSLVVSQGLASRQRLLDRQEFKGKARVRRLGAQAYRRLRIHSRVVAEA